MEAWQTSPWQDGYSQYGTIYMPSSGQGLISNTHSKYQQQINYINKQGKKKTIIPTLNYQLTSQKSFTQDITLELLMSASV